MLRDEAQKELVRLLQDLPVNGLEVERKHDLDKRSETTKVTGCAGASQNSIIRRYPELKLLQGKARNKASKKAAHLNRRAWVPEKLPEWFTRGRGRLRWQANNDEDRRGVLRDGDPAKDKVNNYIQAH